MDAFWERPRANAPQPLLFRGDGNNVISGPPSPIVPEVSLILQPTTNSNNNHNTCAGSVSYNQWKNKNHNFATYEDYKKVRFERPTTTTTDEDSFMVDNSNFEKNVAKRSIQPKVPPNSALIANREMKALPTTTAAAATPFEDIYMANIPNRHLDLSFADLTKSANNLLVEETNTLTIGASKALPKSQMLPNCDAGKHNENKEIDLRTEHDNKADCQQRQDEMLDQCIDLYNYKRGSEFPINNESKKSQPHYISYHDWKSTQYRNREIAGHCTENNGVKRNQCEMVEIANLQANSNEPSVKDLLKIIQQQNDQLVQLQKQVASLVSTRDAQNNAPPVHNSNNTKNNEESSNAKRPNRLASSTQYYEAAARAAMSPAAPSTIINPLQNAKAHLKQFSVDVMTSFEVSIRPQNRNAIKHYRQQQLPPLSPPSLIREEPRIEELHDGVAALPETSPTAENVLGDIWKKPLKEKRSIHFHPDSLLIEDNCPSPQQSINIDMKDYSSEFLSTGTSFRNLAYSFRMGKTTVAEIVAETIEVLWNNLFPIHMKKPSTEDYKQIAEDYLKIWNFPHCLGSLDGKHIRIRCPVASGTMFYNYKGYYSIVLQALVDSHYRFIHIDVGGYGKQSDGGTFKASELYKGLQKQTLELPESEELPGSFLKAPYVFLADEAYPLMTNLLRPYNRLELDADKEYFNKRLSRARRTVECAFGIITAKWHILQKPIATTDKVVDNIVKVICVLHNTIIDLEGMQHNITSLNLYPKGKSNEAALNFNRGRPMDAAKHIRDVFKLYVCHNPIDFTAE